MRPVLGLSFAALLQFFHSPQVPWFKFTYPREVIDQPSLLEPLPQPWVTPLEFFLPGSLVGAAFNADGSISVFIEHATTQDDGEPVETREAA